MTWVKICGTTNLDDALLAADSGADAIGFVLAPSKRQVTPQQVASIVSCLPAHVEKVGVFLNESPERIIAIVRTTGLTGVQLHGNETLETARLVEAAKLAKLVKGIHAGPALDSELESWSRENTVAALLLDSGNGQQGGGTGKTFDWDQAAAALRRLATQKQVIIAGGLSPENVKTAIDKFRPWGVDVASGVEAEPGRKDPHKVKAFIAAVRSV